MKEFGVSAAIILISKDRKALVLQRNADDTFPNKWTVPGGKVNENDGDFTNDGEFCYHLAECSAIRELKEETGIEVGLNDLQFLCSLYIKAINRFLISFYVVLDIDSGSMNISLSDNQAYAWISRDEIKSYDFIPDIGGEIRAVYEKVA